MVIFIGILLYSVRTFGYVNIIQVISTWGVKNKIDFISLSYTRHAEDVREVCIFITFHLLYVFLDSFTVIHSLHLSSHCGPLEYAIDFSPCAKIQAREFLSKLGDLSQTQIFAKIENVEVS